MSVLIKCDNLTKSFGNTEALKKVSFDIFKQETLGVIGESGSGKSTLARILSLQTKYNSGSVSYEGRELKEIGQSDKKNYYKKVQMIYQNASGSFNPKMSLGNSLSIGVKNLLNITEKEEVEKRVIESLIEVGLNADYYHKKPNQCSGGECQRAAIARAILILPELLICDEATSNLDVSIQANIINLLDNLRNKYKMTILFISHDLALVSCFCERIVILESGNLVETIKAANLLDTKNPYTQTLLRANVGGNRAR